MSYQEKENLVNIISGLLITGVYAVIIFQRHQQGLIDLTEDYRKWGLIFLIFIGVSIIARIIIYIIFHIINAIATREEDIPAQDERDRLIKLKSTRNSHQRANRYTSNTAAAVMVRTEKTSAVIV